MNRPDSDPGSDCTTDPRESQAGQLEDEVVLAR